MEERDLSAKAREAWIRREEHSQETVLAMLRKLEGTGTGENLRGAEKVPLKKGMKKENSGVQDGGRGGGGGGVVRRRTMGGTDVSGIELRRNRRMAKFVEQLPSEEEVEEMEKGVVSTSEETKADWRLSRMGPKVLSYEPAPWEEEELQQQETNWDDSINDETKANWRLSRMGPKVLSYEPAPWEEEELQYQETTEGNQLIPSALERNSQGLEDIVEDEEDSESLRTQYTDKHHPKMLTPPTQYTHPPPPPPPPNPPNHTPPKHKTP